MLIFNRFLEWLGNRTKTVILIPHPITIGNCGEEIYFGLIKAREEHKKLLLLMPYQLPGRLRLEYHNNHAVLDLLSPYRSKFQDSIWYAPACWFITLYFAFFRCITIATRKLFGYELPEQLTVPMAGQEVLWQPNGQMGEFSWDIVRRYQWPKQLQEFIPIELPPKDLAYCSSLRKSIGLPEDAWFVCLHVREGGFHSDHESASSRNASIGNYFQAIEEITSRGGWVVRMGDVSMTPLPTMVQVIDYPFTAAKSAVMDLYLIKYCRLYIGMLSGILDLAMLFQRPTIVVNMCSWLLAFPQRSGDLGLFKHVYSKSQNRYLSPFEWPETSWGGHSAFHPVEDYEFRENTSEELRAVVAEYFDRTTHSIPSERQLKFNQIRIEGGIKLLSKKMFENNHFSDMVTRYRMSARLDSVGGFLGDAFLKQFEQ